MQRPFEPQAPINAGAPSRNRASHNWGPWLFLPALLAACERAPESRATGNETVISADDGTWERLPVGARVRFDGILSGMYDGGGTGVSIAPNLCAHFPMTRRELGERMRTLRPLQRVTVYGSKTINHGYVGCLIEVDQVEIVAR